MEIYTIGYQGLNIKAFMAWLNRYDIDMIADVRRTPQSRKKGFSKNGLRETLGENDIDYIGYPSLGPCKKDRDELYKTGDYKGFFQKYLNFLDDQDQQQQIEELYGLVEKGKRIALLCFEHDPKTCHRTVLAQQIKKRSENGFKIHHLEPF